MLYSGEAVHVDGVRIEVRIYGDLIAATSSFKYLGVQLDSAACSPTAHSEDRLAAFDRAAHLLASGLSRIPSFPHRFLTYSWLSLVVPVMSYGLEVFAHPPAFVQKARSKERKWWRRLLAVGGRAPNVAVQILFGSVHADISWRVRRAALFLRLANAPAGSWIHLAFISHHHLNTPWFRDALQDLELVLPSVRLMPTFAGTHPVLSSSGRWSDEGEWVSFHAYGLPRNLSGHRFRPASTGRSDTYSKGVRLHVEYVTRNLRTRLTREFWSETYQDTVTAATASNTSKLTLLSLRLQAPGRPLHFVLDQLLHLAHRSALSSLLCCDWFFGKHAQNYFARNLLPALPRHQDAIDEAGVERSSICLACWHFRRYIVMEDEFHVLCNCPEYDKGRRALLHAIGPDLQLNTQQDVLHLLSGTMPSATQAFGVFLTRTRQVRRKLKLKLEDLSNSFEASSFAARRAAWRMRRKPACRHGVLFAQLPPGGCRCMAGSTEEADWQHARFMPALCHTLKAIIVKPFDLDDFEHLSALQSRARTLGW